MALVVQRWQRYGQHRLYVKDTNTRAQLGYYDCRTGKLSVKDGARSYEIVNVLRPYLSGAVPEGLQHLMPEYPAPSLWPPSDSEILEAYSASALRPRRRGFPRRSWPRGSRGERVVARRLARLGRDGWDVLHAVDHERGEDGVGQLVIGPPGVFAISTLHHPGARIRVGSQVVWVDNSIREYLRNARAEAASIARRLEDILAVGQRVTPVLAFVGAKTVETHDGHPDVLVVAGEQLDRELRDCRGEVSLAERARILAAAQRTETWSI